MTPKQNKFANAIVAGENPSAAYRTAYDASSMSAKSVSVEAQKLLANPNVALAIQRGKREASEQSGWSRAEAMKRLKEVNDVCLASVRSEVGKASIDGFMASMDRLNQLADLEFEAEMRREGIRNELEMLNPLCLMPKPTRKQIRNVIDNDDTKEKE